MTVLGGLQYIKHRIRTMIQKRFNTDDGIRRATILPNLRYNSVLFYVSIPMTVLGGLQCYDLDQEEKKQHGFNTDDGIRRATIFFADEVDTMTEVSIPMTVLGGLQCGSKPT